MDENNYESYKYYKDLFTRELRKANVSYNMATNIHENTEKINRTLKNTASKFISLDNELRILKSNKIKKYQITRMVNNNRSWEEYKALRNHYKVKINNAKNQDDKR